MAENKKTGISVTGWMISLALHLLLAMAFLAVRPMISENNDDQAAISSPMPTERPIIQEFIDLKLGDSSFKPTLKPTARVDSHFKMGDGPLTAALSGPGGGDIVVVAGDRAGGYANFCGSVAQAQRIVYVVDCSGSMIIAFDYIKNQLARSIAALAPYQYYNITFFAGGNVWHHPEKILQRASQSQRLQAVEYIKNVNLMGSGGAALQGQAFMDAIGGAFSLRSDGGMAADLIYIFTDGEFDQQRLKNILNEHCRRHPGPIQVNIIACGSKENEPFLKNLAQSCNGNYTFVSDNEMARPIELWP